MRGKGLVVIACLAVTALVAALLVLLSSPHREAVATELVVQCPVEGCIAGAVSTASGRLWLEHQDITPDPASGAIGLERTYFRDDTTSSSFGPGWRSILDTRLVGGTGVPVLTGFPSLPAAPIGLEDDVVSFADGSRWAFGSNGLLTAITTRSGRRFSIERENARATILDGENTLLDVTFEAGRVAAVRDKRPDSAGLVQYEYDAEYLVAVNSSVGEELRATYRYGYNPGGGLDHAVDAGGETAITWDDARSVGRIIVGGQATTIQLPTNSDEPTLVSLPGATQPTVYRHDKEGRLLEVRQGESVPLRREYDAEGRLTFESSTADERRFTWTDGRLTRVDSDALGTTELKWDDVGRLVMKRVGDNSTTYEYEGSMRTPSTVTDGAATTSYTYRGGALVRVVDPDGVATDVPEIADTGLTSGAPPLSEMRPDCNASTDGLTLDAACRPVRMRDNGSPESAAVEAAITYDDYGRVVSTAGPSGIEVFTYDERGRVGTTKRGDVTFRNEYLHGRLIRVTTDDGSVFAEYDYDGTGRLVSLSSSHGSVSRSYDSQGRVERIEDGGLVWEVVDFTAAGRPQIIDTPYGTLTISYDEAGRVARSEVSGYGQRSGGETVTTDYDWTTTRTGEVAKVTRGGYQSTLAFEEGKLVSARTPLGYWGYTYDEAYPDRLAAVSGPNGETTYSYREARDGSIRLEQVRNGDQTRNLEWDDFGRLTEDVGGGTDRSFEYGVDGIKEGGSSGRNVTWDQAGLPATVESDGATELWTWNQDRTLKSITLRGGLFSGDRVWTAQYDVDRRLVGFDRRDSTDDVLIEWAGQSGGPDVPVAISGGGGNELFLKWTDMRELQSARLNGQQWDISRDAVRNVTSVSRSGESGREVDVAWRDGLPIGLSSGRDSMTFDQCVDEMCRAELVVDNQTTLLTYSEGSITATTGGRSTTFARDAHALITSGCQEVDDEQICTDWQAEGEVGDRRGLAGFDELLGGTNGQLAGIAVRPLPPDPPALASLPDELRPEGVVFRLPDEELETAIASRAPVVPETYRLDGDGAEVRLARRLADTSIVLANGPGHRASIELLNEDGLAEMDSPFAPESSLGAVTRALADIEPDSILRGVTGVVERYGLDAASFVVSLFTGGTAGVVALVLAVGVCAAGSSSCAALALTGALMLVPALGPIVGPFLKLALAAAVEGAVAYASSASWQDVGIAAGASMLVGLVARNAPSADFICGFKRVWCIDAARTPEAAANAVSSRGRGWGVLTIDRAMSEVRRSEALRDTPPRPGFDRDEFPPAVTRQGGAAARVAYINPPDNRSAGASLGSAIRGLDDGQRFLYLVVNSADLPLSELASVGATPALLAGNDE